jgi:hypothetical protein
VSRRIIFFALSAGLFAAGCPTDERFLSGYGLPPEGAADAAGAGGEPDSPREAEGGEGGEDAGARPRPEGGEAGETPGSGGRAGGVNAGTSGISGASAAGSGGAAAGAGAVGGGGVAGNGGVSSGEAGSGGGGLGGGGSAGAALGGSGGSAGTAGSGAGGTGSVKHACGDMDLDLVDDCLQTIVENSAFDSGIADWHAEANVQIAWNQSDSDAYPESGTLAITFDDRSAREPITMAGAGQCLSGVEVGNYQVGARIFLAGGQNGWAAVNLLHFGESACQGALIAAETIGIQSRPDVWISVTERVSVPPAAGSVLLRLVLVKPAETPTLQARFDNVLARRR